ncbi:hypothetical protein N7457_008438 [Penicillium paradoxum]|uniref:uncharacterized protein n=1 Tax=Penicillium paradoxum TaxID=176176 RepID=UPI002549898F|nr:uncharacterized protein N7457_008438 [Penicillium paradoxum]KAJ5773542.1 hypothetical protein N7457_008438 [Penicillium paradoxum]
MVVHYNPFTKEPYLQLPAPCENIIITPHREHQIEETAAVMTEILNDSRVYAWLQGPPFPFLPEHGRDWVKTKLTEHKALVSTLQQEFETSKSPLQGDNSDSQEKQAFFDQCPFVCIREVTKRDPETGVPLQDVMIGDIGLTRYAFYEVQPNSSELALALEQNNALPAGHKDIVWGIGNYLSPTHHGRGIMSLAVRAIVQDWAIPRMNLHHLKSSYYLGNIGSSRVFEKNNFEKVCTLKDWSKGNPKKGQGMMSMAVMEWKGYF